jgi:NDP-sugar pyrophosphorylase family protein
MKKTLMVLAAGLGSRYGGIKQIAPIGPNGEILIHYAIHDAVLAGFEKIVFVIKREIEADFKAAIGAFAESRAEVAYAFQDEAYLPSGYTLPINRKKMLGTVQALLAAKDVIHEPFAIINADDYYGRESYAICADHLEQIAASGDTQAACMVGYRLKNTISYNGTVNRGICRTEGGKLSGVTETYQIMPLENGLITSNYGKEDGQLLAGDNIVSMNFWGFQPSIFTEAQACFDRFIRSLQPDDLTSEYVLPTMVDDLIRADRIHVEVLPCDCTWMGITYPSDREDVSRGLRKMQNAGIYPACLK